MIALVANFSVQAEARSAGPCDAIADGIAIGDTNVFIKSYPGEPRLLTLWVTADVGWAANAVIASFADELDESPPGSRDFLVSLELKDMRSDAPISHEGFVMATWELPSKPKSVKIMCADEILFQIEGPRIVECRAEDGC